MDIAVSSEAALAIGWFYAATSLMRVAAYAPQVWLVWRCADGARSVSLMTWGSAALSHLAATVYGMVVVGDSCFTAIGIGNFVGSVAIVWVAGAQRAGLLSRRRSAAPAYPWLASTRRTAPLAVVPRAAAPGPIRPADPTTTDGTAAHWRCQALSAAA